MDEVGESPFTDVVRAVARSYGVAEKEIRFVPTQGEVNLTVFLGNDLVLRVPRTPNAARQMAKEAHVIPVVLSAGLPTPELVSYDPTLTVAPSPYMILQRVHGEPLRRNSDPTVHARALASLGEILVALHTIRLGQFGPIVGVAEPFVFSPPALLRRLVEAGEIGTAQRDRLLETFARLRPHGPSVADPVLVHRDVTPSNVMIDRTGRITALLDWGCAEWGSRARDLVGFPVQALPKLYSDYRSVLRSTPEMADDELTLASDALWFHLYLALARLLKEPSTSEDRNWAAPRNATLLDILAFALSDQTEPWLTLLRSLDLGAPTDPKVT